MSLLWGEDEFLLREVALELLGDLQPVEVDGGLWQGGETADLATPSLFGERRALLVSNAKALPDEGVRELARYLEAPDPVAPLVLVAVVGDRAKAPAALVKLVKGVGTVTEVKIQRKELPGWLLKRATAKGLDLAPDGAAALVDTLGEEQVGHRSGLDRSARTPGRSNARSNSSRLRSRGNGSRVRSSRGSSGGWASSTCGTCATGRSLATSPVRCDRSGRCSRPARQGSCCSVRSRRGSAT